MRIVKLNNGKTAIIREEISGLPTARIRKGWKIIAEYRGSSLRFSDPLTREDREYLEVLAK